MARALVGFVGMAVIVAGFGAGAVVARRHWFDGIRVPVSWLIDTVLALVGVLAGGLLLGSVGLFRAETLVISGILVGAIAAMAERRHRLAGTFEAPEASIDHDPEQRWAFPGVLAAASVVAVRWIAELLQTLSRGFSQPDELHYHLTHSALFVQSGETWPVRFTSIGDGAAYHPANSELLHAVGLAVIGSDFSSIFLNLAFAAMAMAAGWAIGGRAGNALAGALIVSVFLSAPVIVSESGSALNDTMGIALLLTAVALLFEAGDRRPDTRHLVLAGLSAGLAAGTKLTVLVPVVALLLVVAIAPHRRTASTLTFVGSAVVGGGYWFVRNLVHTGNPVPALSFGPLPGPDLEFQRMVEFPVTDYLLDGPVWRDYFVPGLGAFFGVLWPLLLATTAVLGVAALTKSVRTHDVRWTLLSVCGLLSLLAYLITPTSAAGRSGEPVLFEVNLRYALPGLLLFALAGLAHPRLRGRPVPVVGLIAVLFLAANAYRVDTRRGLVAVALVIAAALTAGAFSRIGRRPAARLLTLAVAVVAIIAAGTVLNERYLDGRWTDDVPRWSAFEAAEKSSDLRIGVTGFPQNYPFYGQDLSNDVITLGDPSSGDELRPYADCGSWWGAVTDERLDVVVILSQDALAESSLGQQTIASAKQWLRASDAPLLQGDDEALIFDVRNVTPPCTD